MKKLSVAAGILALTIAVGSVGRIVPVKAEEIIQVDAPIELSFGCQNKPDHNETLAMEEFKKIIEERTDGKVTITIYPSGQLGTEREIAEQVMMGTTDMCYTSGATWANALEAPELAVWELPFLCQSVDAQRAIIESIYVSVSQEYMVPKGVRPLFGFSSSVRHLLLTEKTISSADDIEGLKIRVPEITMYVDTWRALGANPTTTPWSEAYTALAQGVVDGVEVDPTSILDANLQEITKNYYRTGHMGTMHLVAINEDVWNTLPENVQTLFLEVGKSVSANQIEQRKVDDAACEQKMIDAGVQIFDMTQEDKDTMFEKVQPLYEQYRTEYGLGDLIDQVRELTKGL